jgi:lysozyme
MELPSGIVKTEKRNEGWQPKPYRCSEGYLTIGYGTNIERISKKEGELLLMSRLEDIVKYDIPQLPEYETLTENRKIVYLDMLYNLGLLKFKTFRRMRKCVYEHRWEDAANEILDSKYAQQVGKRANENARLMRQG